MRAYFFKRLVLSDKKCFVCSGRHLYRCICILHKTDGLMCWHYSIYTGTHRIITAPPKFTITQCNFLSRLCFVCFVQGCHFLQNSGQFNFLSVKSTFVSYFIYCRNYVYFFSSKLKEFLHIFIFVVFTFKPWYFKRKLKIIIF